MADYPSYSLLNPNENFGTIGISGLGLGVYSGPGVILDCFISPPNLDSNPIFTLADLFLLETSAVIGSKSTSALL